MKSLMKILDDHLYGIIGCKQGSRRTACGFSEELHCFKCYLLITEVRERGVTFESGDGTAKVTC